MKKKIKSTNYHKKTFTKKQIKDLLISSGQFIDNIWIDKYVDLIFKNLKNKKTLNTQAHHWFPLSVNCKLCVYMANKKLTKKELEGKTLEMYKFLYSKENEVNLPIKDHIIAHYYLYRNFRIDNNVQAIRRGWDSAATTTLNMMLQETGLYKCNYEELELLIKKKMPYLIKYYSDLMKWRRHRKLPKPIKPPKFNPHRNENEAKTKEYLHYKEKMKNNPLRKRQLNDYKDMKQRKIKLGDTVRLLTDKVDATGEKFLKGTIAVVCDDDNPNCPMIELKNSEGQKSWTSFKAENLEIIEP